MTGKIKTARIAGLIYLGVVLTGIFSLMVVPSKLIREDSVSLTFQNIVNSEALFRYGIACGLLCYIFFFFLPLVLYQLLSGINKPMATTMVLLAIVSVPMYFINAQNELTVLSLIKHPECLRDVSPGQIQGQVFFYIEQYNQGLRLIHIFSGLWLFPFGYLVYQSNFLPKVLGVFLMLGCFGYLTNFFGHLLDPDYSAYGIARYIRLPASIGEISACLWLLMRGVKERPKP